MRCNLIQSWLAFFSFFLFYGCEQGSKSTVYHTGTLSCRSKSISLMVATRGGSRGAATRSAVTVREATSSDEEGSSATTWKSTISDSTSVSSGMYRMYEREGGCSNDHHTAVPGTVWYDRCYRWHAAAVPGLRTLNRVCFVYTLAWTCRVCAWNVWLEVQLCCLRLVGERFEIHPQKSCLIQRCYHRHRRGTIEHAALRDGMLVDGLRPAESQQIRTRS